MGYANWRLRWRLWSFLCPANGYILCCSYGNLDVCCAHGDLSVCPAHGHFLCCSHGDFSVCPAHGHFLCCSHGDLNICSTHHICPALLSARLPAVICNASATVPESRTPNHPGICSANTSICAANNEFHVHSTAADDDAANVPAATSCNADWKLCCSPATANYCPSFRQQANHCCLLAQAKVPQGQEEEEGLLLRR